MKGLLHDRIHFPIRKTIFNKSINYQSHFDLNPNFGSFLTSYIQLPDPKALNAL